VIDKLSDWYRVVNPKPNDETIEKRKKAIPGIVAKLTGPDLCAAVTLGIWDGPSPVLGSVGRVILELLRVEQPSLPTDVNEMQLEIQVACCVALGEIVRIDNNESILAASLLDSSLGLRSPTKKRYLDLMLQELLALSLSSLGSKAQAIRERGTIEITTPEPAKLLAAIREMQRQTAADREELDVLWWLFNDHSKCANRTFSDLPAGAGSLIAGLEIGDRVITPCGANIFNSVNRAMDAIKDVDKEMSLVQLVGQWDASCLALLAPKDLETQKLLREYPALLPLSWVTIRLVESKGTAEWSKELLAVSGVKPDLKLSSRKLAAQVLRERIAQRVKIGE
jgi:hypothetical protein